MTTFADDMTLGEARDGLRELVEEGHRCPCCTQFAKVYRRKLNARMALAAIRLYRAGAVREYVHLPSVAGDGCEGGKLRYWGLVVEESERREDGGRSGWWRMTDLGERFVRAEVSVPKYVRLYDGRRLGLRGEPVTIIDALGERFDYEELMGQ